MSKLIESMRNKDALTHNGALTHSTSLNSVVDWFFVAGASRETNERDLISLFTKAFAESPELALKVLFWARDIRGGAGERNVFKTIMRYLKETHDALFNKLLKITPEYGYWKDVILLEDINNEDIVSWLSDELDKENSLLPKWFPRKGSWFVKMHKHRGMTPKELRKFLVSRTSVVEHKMTEKDWESIDYGKIPSIAFNRYKKAFARNDSERFNMFIESVEKGDDKINTKALFPYHLYRSFLKGEKSRVINAQWKALPDYVGEGSFLPMVDVSGSMESFYGTMSISLAPIDISVSLGVYLSERNKSVFKDAFITFTSTPTLQYLKGSVTDRFIQIKGEVGYNTNLQAAFKLILDVAVRNNLSQEDLPDNILVISDMEFDSYSINGTNLEGVKLKFKKAGYDIPRLVFWNVCGREGNVPANVKDDNVALVSGASPEIIKSLLGGEDFTPKGIMLRAIESERYNIISELYKNA